MYTGLETDKMCKTISQILAQERYGDLPQKTIEGNKIDIFTKVSEPSFQVVWLCNNVLSDI